MIKIVQVNAIFGASSTGTIMENIQHRSLKCGFDAYVAYSIAGVSSDKIINGYQIGNNIDEKIHAILSRVCGKQAYYSFFPTLKFIRFLGKLKPDIVHLHNLHNNYINLNILLKYLAKHDIATVITMHDCWYFTGGCFHYTNAGCYKWQYGCGHCPKRMSDTPVYLCDASKQILNDRNKYLTAIPRLYIVGCSQWVANEARKSVLRNCNIRHIYNGFDLDVFKPTPSDIAKKLGLEGKRILLGPASKWLSEVNKNTLDYFIKYMPKDSVLILFGAKEHNNKYLAYNVLLYGYTRSREKMAQLYSMADVFVNCSREDTLSSLNLEAQACGTPVVTYEATGNKETVCNGYGHAVETGNAKALFAATEQVLAQGKESYSTPCINWVKSNFDKQTNYEKYIRLYREIVG